MRPLYAVGITRGCTPENPASWVPWSVISSTSVVEASRGCWSILTAAFPARILLLMEEFGRPGEPEMFIPPVTQETLADIIGNT
jgi:hypothetical protein